MQMKRLHDCSDMFLSFLYSKKTCVHCLLRLSYISASKSRCHWHSSPAPPLITSDGQFPLKRGQIYCATECAEGFLGRWARTAEMERRKEDSQDKLGFLKLLRDNWQFVWHECETWKMKMRIIFRLSALIILSTIWSAAEPTLKPQLSLY